MRAFVPLSCVLGLAACDELLFGSLLTENPGYCVDSATCKADESCDTTHSRCVPLRPPDMAQGPAPSITEIVPKLGANQLATPLAINGRDFRPGVRVTIGARACTDLLPSATQLRCTAPPQPTSCMPQDIVVENYDLTRATSTGGFTYFASTPSFAPGAQTTLAVGSNTRGIAAADLNHDQKIDLITSNEGGANSLSVFLGEGNGTFGAPRVLSTANANNVFWVLPADLNGDSHIDLVATAAGSNMYTVYLGLGDGTFSPGKNASSVVVAPGILIGSDINSDGNIDLILSSQSQALVGVALGRGDGSFQGVTTLSTLGASAFGVAVGDANGDGSLDILATQTTLNSLVLFRGDGKGGFQSAVTVATTSIQPSGLVATDLDGDQKLDLVVGTIGALTFHLEVFFGNGDGTFKGPTFVSTGGNNQQGIQVVDINGDGIRDIVSPNITTSSWSVIPGLGSSRFGAPITFPFGNQPTAVAVADASPK